MGLFRIRCLQKRTRQKLFIMGFETIWYSRPRKYGQGSRNCRACSNRHGMIRKYGLNLCRQCFGLSSAFNNFDEFFFIGFYGGTSNWNLKWQITRSCYFVRGYVSELSVFTDLVWWACADWVAIDVDNWFLSHVDPDNWAILGVLFCYLF